MTCVDTTLGFVQYDRGYHVLGTHCYGFVDSFKINRIPACFRKSESGIQLKSHSMVTTFINDDSVTISSNYRTCIIKCVSFRVNLPHKTEITNLNRAPDWPSAVDYSLYQTEILKGLFIVNHYIRTTRSFSNPLFDLLDRPNRDTPSHLKAQQTLMDTFMCIYARTHRQGIALLNVNNVPRALVADAIPL
uniref:DUF4915 domain-containing protein n=1 Tax=Panagrellus redivivus TaxID=6233 RepID=A0A7E4VG20_PANRE